MPRSRVTIRDVAAHAGVSHQTVSRVINNVERVSPETREIVEASIHELGYRPNAIARSMARGRTSTLACISPNLTDFTFASIIEGAESEIRKHDYFLVSSSASTEEEFSSLVEELFIGRRAEGLFVINPYVDNRHNLLPPATPTVFVGACRRKRDLVSSAALDNYSVARQATQHLIELGHRQIAMITGPMVEDCTLDRCSGYEQALEDHGISYDPGMVINGDWDATSGYQAMKKFLELSVRPTAIFAQNDRMAIGILRAARELDINVPGELSVIGVDDMPLSSYFDPPLTTMRQDPISLGREAARLLIENLERQESMVEHVLMEARLIQRQSTGLCTPGTGGA